MYTSLDYVPTNDSLVPPSGSVGSNVALATSINQLVVDIATKFRESKELDQIYNGGIGNASSIAGHVDDDFTYHLRGYSRINFVRRDNPNSGIVLEIETRKDRPTVRIAQTAGNPEKPEIGSWVTLPPDPDRVLRYILLLENSP